jgi:hypothetical protein
VATLALLASCPSSKHKVDTTSARTPSDASDAAPYGTVLGSYDCVWKQESKEFTAPCEISSNANDAHFSMILELGDLQGQTKPATYGFHFVGALTRRKDGSKEPVEVDFLTQGPGAFAAVLQLESGTLVKLNLQKRSS